MDVVCSLSCAFMLYMYNLFDQSDGPSLLQIKVKIMRQKECWSRDDRRENIIIQYSTLYQFHVF